MYFVLLFYTLTTTTTTKRLKARIEELLESNERQKAALKNIADSIKTRIVKLQEQKCRLDNLVFVSLEQDCGFGCQLHTILTGFLLSFYWERTLIVSKVNISGMKEMDRIFEPIATKCSLNNMDNATSNFNQLILFLYIYMKLLKSTKKIISCQAINLSIQSELASLPRS